MFHQTQLKYFPPGGPINRTWANVSYLARWARRELSRRTPPERPLKLAWGSVLSVSLARTAANSHSNPHTHQHSTSYQKRPVARKVPVHSSPPRKSDDKCLRVFGVLGLSFCTLSRLSSRIALSLLHSTHSQPPSQPVHTQFLLIQSINCCKWSGSRSR